MPITKSTILLLLLALPGSALAANPDDVPPADVPRAVECKADQCTIDRAVFEKLLASDLLLSAARFVPSLTNGTPTGFKIYAIRPNSILDKLHVQPGDEIRSINGIAITTPDAVTSLSRKLRRATRIVAQITRRGRPVALELLIR
jgi:general secretion pathway protein C